MIFNNRGVVIPDVSFYQDIDSTPQGINFAAMRATGASGVIIRAGQNSWRDEDFATNWQAAKAAGLPRGSYWFFDSRAEPGNQASLWRGLIDGDLPELGLWVDLEEDYKGTWQGERNWKTFIEAVKIHFPGVLIGIYSADWWWFTQTVTDPAYFAEYPLWVSQYINDPALVVLPYPWRRENRQATFWQFTASGDGAKYGAESKEIDLSYFNGDFEAYKSYFGLGGDVIPPIPQPIGGTMQGTVTNIVTRSLNVRDALGNVVSALRYDFAQLKGDVVYGEVKPDNRIYFSKIYRVNGTVQDLGGLCSAITKDGSSIYMTLADVPEPTPDPQPEPLNIPMYLVAYFTDGTSKRYLPE